MKYDLSGENSRVMSSSVLGRAFQNYIKKKKPDSDVIRFSDCRLTISHRRPELQTACVGFDRGVHLRSVGCLMKELHFGNCRKENSRDISASAEQIS